MTTSKGKFYLILSLLSVSVNYSISEDPVPTPWPPQFHSIYVTNFSGVLEITDLWYDWPNGRNFNIVQHQLGTLLYGIEWNNGTEFLYTLDSSKTCDTIQFEVGLLPPKWLDGAHYLGQRHVDGFLCNVWEKVDFIWYYEDVETKIPVYWLFYDGIIPFCPGSFSFIPAIHYYSILFFLFLPFPSPIVQEETLM